MPCFFFWLQSLKSQFLDTNLKKKKSLSLGGFCRNPLAVKQTLRKCLASRWYLLFEGGDREMWGVCAALSGVVIRFINAGITRDGSSPLLLTHSVASFLLRATGIASASPSSICLSCLLSLSFPLPPSLASSFFFWFQTLLLPPCHFCLCLPLSLSLSPSVCACRHQWQSQTGRPLRLHKVTWNTRWEKKCQGDNSL